jgi:hypothetical protein
MKKKSEGASCRWQLSEMWEELENLKLFRRNENASEREARR